MITLIIKNTFDDYRLTGNLASIMFAVETMREVDADRMSIDFQGQVYGIYEFYRALRAFPDEVRNVL